MKYEGYIKRQEEVIQQFKKLEHRWVPEDFDYQGIKGFSNEVAEKLKKVRPSSYGKWEVGLRKGFDEAIISCSYHH